MPHVLPVVHSILSTSGLITEVLSRYDIGEVTECRFLRSGLNDTYFVSSEAGKFALRVYRKGWRSHSDILFELDAILHLNREGVCVSIPVPRRDGEMLGVVAAPEGLRHAVLFTYAHGKELTHKVDGDQGDYLYGKMVGRIHAATDGFESTHPRYLIDLEHLLTNPLRSMQPFLSHRPKDWDYIVGLSKRLRSRMEELPLPRLEMGFCHGDLHGGNAHIDQSSILTAFDFDCCGFGWRAYDVAVFCWGARMRGKEKERWPSFIRGYTEERGLSDVDTRAIPLFAALRNIWFIGLYTGHSHDWGSALVNDGFFDQALKFFREWAEEHLSD